MVHQPQLSGKIAELVDHLRQSDSRQVQLADVASVTEVLIETMGAYFQSIDSSIYREIKDLSDYIEGARAEIAELTPTDIKTAQIPRAGRELEAIVKATEEATNGIMESAEAIMNADAEDKETLKKEIEGHCMHIFEQCSFQDITGQRISKVVHTLSHIENRIDALKDIWGVEEEAAAQTGDDGDEYLMRGPALEGEGMDQSAVDELIDHGDASGEPATESAEAAETAAPAAATEDASSAESDSAQAGTEEAGEETAEDAEDQRRRKSNGKAPAYDGASAGSNPEAAFESEDATQADIDALFS